MQDCTLLVFFKTNCESIAYTNANIQVTKFRKLNKVLGGTIYGYQYPGNCKLDKPCHSTLFNVLISTNIWYSLMFIKHPTLSSVLWNACRFSSG